MTTNRQSNESFVSYSDDEDNKPVLRKKNLTNEKLWDSFEDPPEKQTTGSSVEAEERFDAFLSVVKIIVSIIVFLVIVGASCISMISMLFMTSHITPNKIVPFCDINQPEKNLMAYIPEVQRIAWIWAIFFSFAFPEFLLLLRSIRICTFKSVGKPIFKEILIELILETFHIIGLVILVISVIPKLDVVKAAMLTHCVMIIPSILIFLSRSSTEERIGTKYILDIAAIIIQITGFFVWPLIDNEGSVELWLTPVALFLISFQWWENFVSPKSRFELIRSLYKFREKLEKRRYINYIFVSTYKIIIFLFFTIIMSNVNFIDFFGDFQTGWGDHIITVNETIETFSSSISFPELINGESDNPTIEIPSTYLSIFWVTVVQIVSSYICYSFSKFACKIKIQLFSFSLALLITVPVTIIILMSICGLRATDICYFHNILPDYLFFIPPPAVPLEDYLFNQLAFVFIFWIASQIWITIHVWSSSSEKNAPTDVLFVMPMYCSLIMDKTLLLNRRCEHFDALKKSDVVKEKNARKSEIDEMSQKKCNDIEPLDRIPKIFICATMWHETKDEMMEFLKSILRLDDDQCARRMALNHLTTDKEFIDSEYYDLETHIFFDDAFIVDKKKYGSAPDATSPLNSYVKLLINSIEEAAREVHHTNMKIYYPARTVTPYGGRLEWTLPGRTKMIAHLKHSEKIRRKKRWSQVMYMYYLLGYKIMQLDASDERKNVISQNTFLLALDGDIDFQPKAVHLLVSRMKIDDMLGAACGRIHPIGSGPMVWYQKFEYAIGHWLQKATEHVIGCVLCSPGCFSLFRGRALMENSVMKKYTTVSDCARHYVQYDQGEDRWLCTLLLKQKFRVEYSAASDAYTHSPEGFNEFYNQRRRWLPSTIANILDLLADAKSVVKKNDSISSLYILYQILLMFGTILGPGTIFLMMIGAMVSVFRIDLWTSFLYNFIPLFIFMVVCYKFKSKYQLITAFIISTIYALIMMAVLIGVLIQLQEDGIFAPTSLFFLAVVAQIVVTGLLHPLEIICLFFGIVYYITIPSMYMLLVIYSLFNMNDVSWGTRENKAPPAAADDQTKNNNEVNESQSKFQKYFGFLKPKKEEQGTFDFSFAGLFRCMLCTQPKPDDQAHFILLSNQLNDISNRLYQMEVSLLGDTQRIETTDERKISSECSEKQEIIIDDEILEDIRIPLEPDWIHDQDIRNGDRKELTSAEVQFWEELIEKYLKPEKKTEEEKKEIQTILAELRDKCVFAFLMINSLFVLMVFLLQSNKEYLHIQWPLGATNYITFESSTYEIIIKREYLELEPIGFVFVLFFGIILIVQFIAMLIHRFGTVSEMLAATYINCYCTRKPQELSAEAEMSGRALKIARALQKPMQPASEDTEVEDVRGRRNTVRIIMQQKEDAKTDRSNLENNFKRAFASQPDKYKIKFNNPATMDLFNHRRSTFIQTKARNSTIPNFNISSTNLNSNSTFNYSNDLKNFNNSYDNQAFLADENFSASNSNVYHRTRSLKIKTPEEESET